MLRAPTIGRYKDSQKRTIPQASSRRAPLQSSSPSTEVRLLWWLLFSIKVDEEAGRQGSMLPGGLNKLGVCPCREVSAGSLAGRDQGPEGGGHWV